MTAVVGILNKQGVAIAADSAVTVGGEQHRKVYNSANKIFTLSKYHPVGIAIYNNAEFMGIPWETIIKEFRRKLGKRYFPKLEDYKSHFFEWLNKNNHFLNEHSGAYVFSDFVQFVQFLIDETLHRNKGDKSNIEADFIGFIQYYIQQYIPNLDKVESMKYLDVIEVKQLISSFVPEIIDRLEPVFEKKLNQSKIETPLVDSYIAFIQHKHFLQFTGLIFTGFGDTEVFPQLIPVNVSIVIGSCLKYDLDVDKCASVDIRNTACIAPFAQTDVIDTILQGISPELKTLSSRSFEEFINTFLNEIKNVAIPIGNTQINTFLTSLDTSKYIDDYQQILFDIIKQRHVNPLINAVAQLSKEDLSEMAESLIYLTYLKRRFTMEEESVGGPVDIAVITKGDGFIWIKRKHYFDPKLNQSFFQRYLNL